ncbi:UNVERIFIED_CONTAM: hypothetical protein HHA_451150 [Hammondia hammondi]|eukprot:XP_008883807.1 hypothetical protein HHA_451150 [Hammondia hammondi]
MPWRTNLLIYLKLESVSHTRTDNSLKDREEKVEERFGADETRIAGLRGSSQKNALKKEKNWRAYFVRRKVDRHEKERCSRQKDISNAAALPTAAPGPL